MPATTLVENPTEEEFERLVASHDTVVVDFAAAWCAPCHAYSPKFSRAAREVRRRAPEGSFVFAKIDIDLRPKIARRFSVRSVPTTVVIAEKKGWFRSRKAEVSRWSGDRPWNDLVGAVASAVGVDLG